jgi:hypothetical protein|tara:strand:+ start:202 stop:405 length:204 start_codon:yes stop_codon:yes gene_type:complete
MMHYNILFKQKFIKILVYIAVMAIVKVMAFLLYEVATCLKLIPMTVTTVWTREIECVFSLLEVSKSI